jgi:hypothetical protein
VKPKILIVAAAAIGLGLIITILGLAKATQSDLDRARAQADLHAEKATRLLANYQTNLSEIALLRGELSRQLAKDKTPVAVPPQGAELKELVGASLEEFKAVGRETSRRLKQGPAFELEQRIHQLVPDASKLNPAPTLELGQNEPQITRRVAEAVKQVDGLIAENAKLLKQALREADAALAVQVGSADMRNHINANQLRAEALYLAGCERRNEGLFRRLEAQRTRSRAADLIDQSADILAQSRGVEACMPAQLKASLEKERKELQALLAGVEARAKQLRARIEEKLGQIAAAKAEADAAAKALTDLEAKGYDPKNPADVRRYVEEYGKQADRQRRAGQQILALEAGTLEGARLDDAYGGDFLADRYVAEPGKKIEPVKGLKTLETELNEAQQQASDVSALIKTKVERINKAESLAKELTDQLNRLAEAKKAVDQQVVAALAGADGDSERAAKAEAEALSQFDAAGKAYAQAARAAGSGGATEQTTIDPGIKDWAKAVNSDTEAGMIIGQADVAYSKALVFLQQLRDMDDQLAVAAAAIEARVTGVDRSRLQKVSDELPKVREAAVKAIDESVKLGARNPLRGRKYEWAGQASLAADYHLKSLLTEGADSAEALGKAISEYENAVKKREGSPFIKPYVQALAYLKRSAAGAQSRPSSRPAASRPAAGGVDRVEAARSLVKLMVEGRFEAIADRFNQQMKEALPSKKLADTWKPLSEQLGAFEQEVRTQQGQEAGFDVVLVTCRFRNAEVNVRVAFDPSGRVSGFSILPASGPGAPPAAVPAPGGEPKPKERGGTPKPKT